MTTAAEILKAKRAAGPESYLWVHTSGDIILWPSEEISHGDSGIAAIARWLVEPEVVDELVTSGEADEVA